MAAAAAAAVVGLPDAFTADQFTGTAERKTVALDDGTMVELDAETAIALDLSPKARTVHLLRGRASFDVAKDAGRPFSVLAADGAVTAHGTRFTVHEWAGAVTRVGRGKPGLGAGSNPGADGGGGGSACHL